MLITSLNNKHIKEIALLKNKKNRDDEGVFLVETKHLVLEAYKYGLIKELILEQNELFPLDVPTTYVTKDILKKISILDCPSNVMAIVNKPQNNKIGEKILILDNIQDPGNLGTMIRSAKAFNFDTIITSNDTVDFYNPKVVRASQGMLFDINIISGNLEEIIHDLKENSYKILGTKVDSGIDIKKSQTYSHFALIIGNEGQGIREEILSLCDEYVYIKMNEDCESLNAAVAASIIMYEINNK